MFTHSLTNHLSYNTLSPTDGQPALIGGVRGWAMGCMGEYQQVCCSTLNWGPLDHASRGLQFRVLAKHCTQPQPLGGFDLMITWTVHYVVRGNCTSVEIITHCAGNVL